MSLFTKDNFSYSKILTVLGTGICFLVSGFLFDSPKGYFVGFFVTLVGIIYLFCRAFIDLGFVGRIIAFSGLMAVICGGGLFVYSELDKSKNTKLDEAGLAWQLTPFGKKGTVHATSYARSGGVFIVGNYEKKNDGWQAAYGKVSSEGKLLWKNKKNLAYDASLETVHSLQDGGAILAGREGLVIRINDKGDILWSENYGMPEDTVIQRIKDVVELEDGRIVIVGSVYQRLFSPNGDRGYAALLASNGNLIWEKMLGSDGDMELNSLALLDNQGFVTVGYTKESGQSKAIIIKLDFEGNALDSLELGDDFSGFANDVFITEKGKILVGGSIDSFGNGVTDMALYSVSEDIKTASLTRYVGRYTGRHSINVIDQQADGKIILAGSTRQVQSGRPHSATIFDVDLDNRPLNGWHDPFVNGSYISAMTLLPSGAQVIIEARYNAYPGVILAFRQPRSGDIETKINILEQND